MADKKRGLVVVVVIGAFLLYYFIASRPLLSELEFQPRWVARLGQAPGAGAVSPPATLEGALEAATSGVPAEPGGGAAALPGSGAEPAEYLFPFMLGKRFGYADDKGRILLDREVGYGVAFSPRAWSAFDGVHEEVSFKDPAGGALFTVATTGYPFILRDRYFVIGNDRASVAEYSGSGKLLWTRDFPATLTCADANGGLFVAGCVTGDFVLVGPGGETLSEFAPGGSRLPCAYGTAVSADGQWFAALSGVGEQRLVVLQRRADGYKVAWHEYLGSDYRRTVKLAFSNDSRVLFLEQPGRLAFLDLGARRLDSIPVAGEIVTIEQNPFNGIYLLLSRSGRDWTLSGIRMPGKVEISIRFGAYQASLYQRGSSVYLGINESILRVDMKEN